MFAVFDKSVTNTVNDPHPLLFSFVTEHLRFVFRPVCRLVNEASQQPSELVDFSVAGV